VDPVSPSTMSLQIRTKCSQSDIEGNISKEYKLNINKALKKKLEATQRDRSVSYNHTMGGIVITADAATFELFMSAALSYYKTLNDDVTNIEIQEITDKTRKVVVQYTFRVELPSHQKYTVNLYTTTSKLLVNGKDCEVFIQNEIPNIQTIIVNEVTTIPNFDVNLLNRQLQEQLTHLINGNKVNNDNIQCSKCTKFCRSRSTYCTSGNHWIHYRCEKLTKDQITQREESDDKDENYTCKRCIQTPGLRQIEYINVNEETMAKSILLDEDNSQTDETIQVDDDQPQNQCFICNNIATSDEGDTCVICDKWCHTICMDSNVDDQLVKPVRLLLYRINS
jgi:hypothetical protein